MRQAGVALLLVASAVAVLLTLPSQIRYWSDRVDPEIDAALLAADARLPPSSGVLVVTAGVDPRHSEYTFFHRALYDLVPRPVWWLNPAPSDGTWESRWWMSSSIDAAAIQRAASVRRVSFALFHDVPVPDGLGRRTDVSAHLAIVDLGAETVSAPAAAPVQPSIVRQIGGTALGIIVALAAGFAIVGAASTCGPRAGRAETLALAFPLGSGAIAVGTLFLSLLGLNTAGVTSAAVIASGAGAAWVIARHRRLTRPPQSIQQRVAGPRVPIAAVLLVAVIILCTGWVAVRAIGRPLTVWDSWVTWGMKARQLDRSDYDVASILADSSRGVTNRTYPLLVPLIEVWTYRWAGSADDRLAGVPAVCFFLSLPAICYAGMRRLGATSMGGLVIATVAAASPVLMDVASAAFADVPLAVYVLIAGLYLVIWIRDGTPGALIVAALASGLAASTKQEGCVFLVALMVAVVLANGFSPRARRAAVWLLAAGIVFAAPWFVLVWLHGADNVAFASPSIAVFVSRIDRLPVITWHLGRAALRPESGFLWIAVAAAVVWRVGKPRRAPDVLLVSAALYLIMMGLSFVFSDYVPYQQHIAASSDRILAHLVPLGLLWLGATWWVRLDDLGRTQPAISS